MDNKEQEMEKLQWHPAFYAGLQIELKEDSDNLIFENEHQLGTKPKQIQYRGTFLLKQGVSPCITKKKKY